MRAIRLAFLLATLGVLGAAAGADARSWQGVEPGTSVIGDVTARFGVPTTQGKLSGRDAAVYKGDQAIAGTRQAQFFLRDDGVVAEVVVFPASQLDREAVEGTYGQPTRKAFTEEFRPVWLYDQMGLAVFFGKDGFVDAISFRPPEARPVRPLAPAASTPARPVPRGSPARPSPSPAPVPEGR